MKAAYRTTLCLLLIFALRVVGVESIHEDDSSSTDGSSSTYGSSSIGEGNRKERIDPCATVKCADPCSVQPYPCSRNRLCVPGKKNGCCPEAKCCRNRCKKSKRTKAAKSCQKEEVCQLNYSKTTKNFCPTAECIDICSITNCLIGDQCDLRTEKCDNGFVCRNTFNIPTDCCSSGSECVKDLCSNIYCIITDQCDHRTEKCDDGLVCRNTFKIPTDCCPSDSECVRNTIF